MPTHILLIVSDMGLGGIQKKIVDLAKSDFKESEFKDLIFHCVYRGEKTFFTLPKSSNFIFHPEPKMRILRRYQEQYYNAYLLFLFLRYRPHTTVFFLHYLAARVLNLKKYFPFIISGKLVISQDTILSYYNQKLHAAAVFSKKKIQEVYKQVDSILVQTNAAKNDLVTNYSIPQIKIKVIPNWLPEVEQLDRKTSYPEAELLYYGRLESQKRIDVMLKVFKKIVKRRPQTKLTIVGSGSQKDILFQLMRDLKLSQNIYFLQPTPDVSSLLQKSKILLSTSEFEGFPLTLLEAMAVGVVPVVLPFPGAEEYLVHGETAFIEKNESQLEERVISLLEHPKSHKKISDNAKLHTKQHYGKEVKKEFIKALL